MTTLLLALALTGCWSAPSDDAAAPPDAAAKADKPGKGTKADKSGKAHDTDEPAAGDDDDAEPQRKVHADRPPAPQGPNVLVIVWDTVRADHTSLYGYDKPTTPHLAAWAAANGVVYDRAVSPGVWTLPSHASLFTALPGRTHGVDAAHTRLDDSFTTFAMRFSDLGYDTYAFVSNPYIMDGSHLLEGFDLVDRPWQNPWRTKVHDHIASKLIPDDASTPLSPQWPRGGGNNKYLFKESGPVLAEAVFQRLEERQDDGRPWFVFVNYMEAHLPRIPTLASRQAVMTPDEIARSYHVEQTTERFHRYMTGVEDFDDADLAALRGVYDAALIDLDAATKELLDGLRARGLDDDTIVVLTSDHGESLGEHKLLLHKYAIYNALTRVPLVVSWPGHLTPGHVTDAVSVADVLPKVIELGHIPFAEPVLTELAARPAPQQPGVVSEYNAVAKSLLKQFFRRHPGAERERFFDTWQAIELGDYKFLESRKGKAELYDVVRDPHETHDLTADEAAQAEALKAALAAWREAVPEHGERADDDDASVDPELRKGLEALGYMQ
ncbi:MAG: sulfatase [Alphaproteobacteria bacterium]|nr:sulfatase [Alphaproteobacteria bacterium]